MNPVREAIIELLENDGTLSGLATAGVHWSAAPQGTQVPYVIVSKQAGTYMHTFDGPPSRNEVYLVKGVGFPDDAEAIDERCQELLANAQITVDGRDLLLAPMELSDFDYTEEERGERAQHVGTSYRIVTEGAS